MMIISGMHTRSSGLVTALALCIAELLVHVAAVHEALLFASPQDINQRTKKALKTLGHEATVAGNPLNLSSSCLHGLPTCLWESDENHVKALAAREAEARLAQLEPTSKGKPQGSATPNAFALLGPAGASSVDGSKTDLAAQLRALPAASDSGLASQEQQVSAEVQAHVRGLRVLEEVRVGAVLKAEALPSDVNAWVDKAQRHRHEMRDRAFLGYNHDALDHGWRLATRDAEEARHANASAELQAALNQTVMDELRDWLRDSGAQLTYVSPIKEEGGWALSATEEIGEGEGVLTVPLKLTLCSLTLRLVKTKRGLLKEHLDQVFARRPDWGLAVFLLYEQRKGADSRWWPFIRSLQMHVPRNAVLKELEGSSAGELFGRWEREAQVLLAYLRRQGPCQHDFYGLCEGWLDQAPLRWALWVVRRYAVHVRKSTTGKDFLALVPMAHLLRHQPSANGSLTLGLDNTVRVAVGAAHHTGDTIAIDRGPWSDAECLLRWHSVPSPRPSHSHSEDEEDDNSDGNGPCSLINPYNRVQLALPAVAREHDDLYFGLDRNQEWRTLMRYPPKQLDLWIATNHLLLYGDTEDEEEQRLVENANKLLAGLPVTVKSEEERLMLLGAARDEDEARALMHSITSTPAGHEGAHDLQLSSANLSDSTIAAPQLYLAVETDEDEDDAPARAVRTLASAVLDLQDAVIASSVEASVQKCVNRTRDFFVHGIRPLRGLDEIDKMLKRKRQLLDQCGSSSAHVITAQGRASDELLCAVRVLFMNETDLDVLCPPGEAPFYDMECRCARRDFNRECVQREDHFNISLPISRNNENKALQVLISSLEAILRGYRTSVSEDEALLALSTVRERTPVVASAIVTRCREKTMLQKALHDLRARQAALQDERREDFQVEALSAKAEAAVEEEKRHQDRLQELRSKAAEGARVLTTVMVDVTSPEGGGTRANLTIREGEPLDVTVQRFAAAHGIGQQGVQTLIAEAKRKLPVEGRLQLVVPILDPSGVRRVLSVREGDNATQRALEFCLAYHVADHEDDDACRSLATQAEQLLEKRLQRKVILTVPVNLADGRSVLLDIREGDEHEPVRTVANFAATYRLPEGYVGGLTQEVERRLPRPIVMLPVNVDGGRQGLNLRVSSLDRLMETVRMFCETYGLPEATAAPVLRQRVLAMVNPDALVMPAK